MQNASRIVITADWPIQSRMSCKYLQLPKRMGVDIPIYLNMYNIDICVGTLLIFAFDWFSRNITLMASLQITAEGNQ